MAESTSEKFQDPGMEKYPDPRLWLTAGAKGEVFDQNSVLRLNTLGGHEASDTLGILQSGRVFETGKNGEIILHFSASDVSEKRQQYLQNMVTEYFAHVFRTSVPRMGISGKFRYAGKEQNIRTLATLPIFDTSGDASQKTESFYDIMHSEELDMIPQDRAKILSYLDFLSDVSSLAIRTIGSSVRISETATATLHPSGVMRIDMADGSTLEKNLLDIYTAARSPSITEQKRELQKIHQDRQELRDSMRTESLFDGKILIKYAPSSAIVGYATMEGYDAVRSNGGSRGVFSAWNRQSGERIIKELIVRTTEGRRVILGMELSENNGKFARENVLRELRKHGIQFDPKSGEFIQPEVQAIRRALQRSLEEARVITNYPDLSQAEYDKAKTTLEGIERESIRSGKPIRKLLGKGIGALDKILLPLFLAEFSKNQNTISFVNGLSDWAAFHYGAKLGAHLGDIPYLGPVTKVGGKLVGGMVFGVGGLGLKKYGVDLVSEGRRSFWRYAFQKTDGVYTDGRSSSAHYATSWAIPEGLDKGNDLSGSDVDIGIPAAPEQQQWIPEITMFQRKVNMGTSPWEWLGQSEGRTIDDWNRGVDSMKVRIAERLGDVLRAYQKREGVFRDPDIMDSAMKWAFGSDTPSEKAGSRPKLFAFVLKEILVADGMSGYFSDQVYGITASVERELEQNPDNPRLDFMLDVINNEISLMKVDADGVELQESMFEAKRQELGRNIAKLKPRLGEQQYQYVISIFDRMVNNEEICAPGKWEEYRSTFTGETLRRYIPSQENRWYQAILDNNDSLDLHEGKMKVGEYFALLLDFMVSLKMEQEFIKEVKSGNSMGIKWSSFREDASNLGSMLGPH